MANPHNIAMGFWSFVDDVAGGIARDWQNGNRVMAAIKTAGWVAAGVAVVAGAIAAAPVSAGVATVAGTVAAVAAGVSTVIGAGVMVADTIPHVIKQFKDGYNETMREIERSRQSPPANDKTSELTPSAPAATYAAVDTTRLTASEAPAQQVAAAPAPDPKEQQVAPPASAVRPTPAIRPA